MLFKTFSRKYETIFDVVALSAVENVLSQTQQIIKNENGI